MEFVAGCLTEAGYGEPIPVTVARENVEFRLPREIVAEGAL